MLVPINIAGGDYQHKSRPLDSQATRNFWPQLQGSKKARSPYVLESFYGLSTFKQQSGGADRGMLENQGVFYRVAGTTLYTVTADGAHTSRGTIPGTNRCMLRPVGEDIVITNGSGAAYVYDSSATTLTEITDSDLASPNGVTVINNQAIFDDGDGEGWVVSDAGDPATIDALNTANAESSPDDLKIPYGYRETLFLMGGKTIEPWWNSGQGNPPFDKIQGGIINIGLDAIHSVADTPDYMFFLGNDKQIHSLTGGTSAVVQPISTPELTRIIQAYTTTSDAIGWTMELQGQWFYVITFPTEDATWCWPVGGEWFQWGSTLTGRIRANSYVNVFGRHLVGDYDSANIYELDPEVYTDVGEEIVRTRITAPIHSGLLNQPGLAFEINSFELFLETGVGLISGQGSSPKIMVSMSKDGGKTFGTERQLPVGAQGKPTKVTTGGFGRFDDECVVKISTSDPIYWSIYSAKVDMELCI